MHEQRLGLRCEVESLRREGEEAKARTKASEEVAFQTERGHQRELKAAAHREEGLRLEAQEVGGSG